MGRRPKQTFLQRNTDGQEAYEKMFNITNYQRNAHQNYNEISLHPSQNGYHQKVHKQLIRPQLMRVWREGNPPTLLMGMLSGAAAVKNSTEVPQETKNRATTWSCNLTPGYKLREKHGLKGYMHPNINGISVCNSQDTEAT